MCAWYKDEMDQQCIKNIEKYFHCLEKSLGKKLIIKQYVVTDPLLDMYTHSRYWLKISFIFSTLCGKFILRISYFQIFVLGISMQTWRRTFAGKLMTQTGKYPSMQFIFNWSKRSLWNIECNQRFDNERRTIFSSYRRCVRVYFQSGKC